MKQRNNKLTAELGSKFCRKKNMANRYRTKDHSLFSPSSVMIQRSRSVCARDTRGKYANVLTLLMRLSSFNQSTVDVWN